MTLRVDSNAVGRLRSRDNYHAIRKAMRTAWAREDFRINQISLERDHIHLIIEAENGNALDRGVRGFMTSAARHLNRAACDDAWRRVLAFVGAGAGPEAPAAP